MSKIEEGEIIDLTTLDYCTPQNAHLGNDVVIDLANDSLEGEENKNIINIKIRSKIRKFRKGQDGIKKPIEDKKDGKSENIGLCSVCWDKLGTNPLASTKCGHVYCLACLEESLKTNKRCPTCRRSLKGQFAYHPLYLELG